MTDVALKTSNPSSNLKGLLSCGLPLAAVGFLLYILPLGSIASTIGAGLKVGLAIPIFHGSVYFTSFALLTFFGYCVFKKSRAESLLSSVGYWTSFISVTLLCVGMFSAGLYSLGSPMVATAEADSVTQRIMGELRAMPAAVDTMDFETQVRHIRDTEFPLSIRFMKGTAERTVRFVSMAVQDRCQEAHVHPMGVYSVLVEVNGMPLTAGENPCTAVWSNEMTWETRPL